jgi:hypothetical protein
MIPLALLSLQILTTFAQVNIAGIEIPKNIGGIEIPNLTGCDFSAFKCLENVTSLILPSGCGTPPESVYQGTLDDDTIQWAKCACPTLVPSFGW